MTEKSASSMAAEIERLQDQLRDLNDENEMLLLQMHRLYAQLDAPAMAQPELAAWVEQRAPQLAFLRHWWGQHHPDELLIDLCGPVPGGNWHEAESDGRWIGPRPAGVLRLPALRPGLYSIRFEVVDSMAPDILQGAGVSVDGTPVATEVLFDGFPALVLASAELPGDDRAFTEVQLHLPRVMSPRERGEDDDRQLGVRVRSVALTWLEAP